MLYYYTYTIPMTKAILAFGCASLLQVLNFLKPFKNNKGRLAALHASSKNKQMSNSNTSYSIYPNIKIRFNFTKNYIEFYLIQIFYEQLIFILFQTFVL